MFLPLVSVKIVDAYLYELLYYLVLILLLTSNIVKMCLTLVTESIHAQTVVNMLDVTLYWLSACLVHEVEAC